MTLAALVLSFLTVHMVTPTINAASARALADDTLRGRVTDASSDPVRAARVTVVELSAAVQTDADGRFAISVPTTRLTLIIESDGFAPETRTVHFPIAGTLEITLQPVAMRLDPVNVTAARTPMNLQSSPLPVSTLGEESVRRHHGVSLADSVSKLAGVHAVTTGEQIGKPMIRGLTGPRVLVLENGHRLEDYSWSDEDGPSIDSRLEQRIEVIRGPASLLYGSDAIGGVINALPAALPDATAQGSFGRGEAELYFASNNREVGSALRYEGASGRLGWRAFLVGRFAEDIHTPAGKLENTGFGAANGEIEVGMHSPAGTTTLRYGRYGGEFKLLEASGPIPGTEQEDEEAEEEGPERKLSDDRLQFDGNYVLGESRLETKAQWQRHFIAELSDDLTQPGGPKVEIEVFNLVLSTLTADVLLHHRAGDLYGTVGISGYHQNNDTRGEVPLVPDARINSFAGFVIEQYGFGRVSLLGGARFEHRNLDAQANPQLSLSDESRDYSILVGNVGAVLHATQQLSFTANVGRAFRTPNLFELFTNGPRLGEARYEIGDPDLKEETSLNLDGSIRLELPFLRGSVSAYRNDIDDCIFVTPTSEFRNGLRVFRYGQTEAKLLGAEVSLEALPTDRITLRGRYDAVRATNEETKAPLPLIPPHYGVVEIEAHGGPTGWAMLPYVGLEAEIVAEKTRVAPDEKPAAGHTVFNIEAGARHRWASRVLRLDLRVLNAFDKEYTGFLSRYREFAPEPGRSIVIRLSTDI